ncbi:FAD binding domain-containing protein [Ancylobacter defluvii]|uniref:Molybdopterin dehydrogenase n=1 Tax=Ancylobacter defluvii TaxID=1282440 RepID=A0A9W6JVE8_9HYPH|nr:FAD binding domain-containing protein [Ancylobacter defluvii]MBS7588602.1 FAD binding domain-containing protein [Ancylobacter defluvii]GLK83882.1 molybdopterin dehydrogenase [Ancylobacter defluvii]
MTPSPHPSLYVAPSLDTALDALAERGAEGAPFAGGTWIMRAPIRHERLRPAYVGLGRIPELTRIEVGDSHVSIGAGVTHARLAEALADAPDLQVLAEAAGRSANPAVRRAATLGGNLCTSGFAAADLVPALLCLDAEVEIRSREGTERLALKEFLSIRQSLHPSLLLTRILVPRSPARSAHARLPLRKAGDYPTAIVSLAVTSDDDGRVAQARIAVGSVEAVARRWTRLEAALAGAPLDAGTAHRLATELAGEFTGRDGVEAPGWYRVSVLPALVRRAVAALH